MDPRSAGRAWDSFGAVIRGLKTDPMEAFIRHVQGTTGMTDRALIERVIRERGLDINTATPEEVYRAGAEIKLGIKMDPPLGPPREYVPPVRPSEAGPERMPVEERVTAPNSRFLDTIADWDPAQADRLRGASADEILEAYRAGPPPPTGMVPLGRPGPGIPVGMSGPGRVVPGPTGMIPAPLRGIPGETRAMSVPGSRALTVPPDQQAAESIAAQFDRAIPRLEYRDIDVDDALLQQAPFMRGEVPQAPRPRSGNGRKLAAAAAAATGAGIIATMPGDRVPQTPASADEPAFTSGGEADLVEETRPAPKVAATEETPQPTVKQGPQDYSLQARALINRLNDMRRAAGGEVPEAPAMMAEINRLIAMGNEQRRQPTFVPGDDASSKYKQAQELINQVNAMYRQGMTPNSPQVRKLMEQVRQLQAAGDAMRNRRAG